MDIQKILKMLCLWWDLMVLENHGLLKIYANNPFILITSTMITKILFRISRKLYYNKLNKVYTSHQI